MQWVQHHPASLPEVLTSEAAWASRPKQHQEQTSKEGELTSATEQASQEEKLTSANRWETSREELTSVTKKPSRATIGICIAQMKGIESIDSRHRGTRVDIKAAPMRGIGIDSRHRRREVDISEALTRGIWLKSRHRKQRVDISILFRLPSICRLHLHQVWELLWVHQCNPATVPALVHPVLASCQRVKKEIYSTEPFVFIFYQDVPCNIHKTIIIYCITIFSNIDLAKLSHHLSNNDMGIKDFYGILFKMVIFAVRISLLRLTIIFLCFLPLSSSVPNSTTSI